MSDSSQSPIDETRVASDFLNALLLRKRNGNRISCAEKSLTKVSLEIRELRLRVRPGPKSSVKIREDRIAKLKAEKCELERRLDEFKQVQAGYDDQIERYQRYKIQHVNDNQKQSK